MSLAVVISQGQSAHPDKRRLEEDLVTALLGEPGIELIITPHLYDLTADSTAMLCLEGIQGDLIVASWLFGRAAHWTLDRQGIKGHFGQTLLPSDADDEDDNEDEADRPADEAEAAGESDGGKTSVGPRDVPNRNIYHLDLRTGHEVAPLLAEIRRIAGERSVKTVSLGSWPAPAASSNGAASSNNAAWSNNTVPGVLSIVSPGTNGNAAVNGPAAAGPIRAAESATDGAAGAVPLVRVDEAPARRWYPVIDYSRCTNCMECIDFCLFGVYGLDGAQAILVEQPDNCRKGCPACSRVCPENAIIFPQHKTPAIAGSPTESAGGLKIDLSLLFGAPNAIEIAAQERDVELVAVGRDAVGLAVGIPKRQAEKPVGQKDDLDELMDQLDGLDL